MTITTRPHTIGELRESGYRVLSVKEEMRKNLIRKIRSGEELFPGIIGYEETVIPQVENAILSGQDIIFLGERGQAKENIFSFEAEGAHTGRGRPSQPWPLALEIFLRAEEVREGQG